MGKATDNHFIDAKRKIKYWGQQRIYGGIVEPVESQVKRISSSKAFLVPKVHIDGAHQDLPLDCVSLQCLISRYALPFYN